MADPKQILAGINYEILQGYRYRGLLPVGRMGRIEFKRYCNQIIKDAVDMAETPEEKNQARLDAIRMLGERSLFFFVTFCLGLDWTDNDYGYRLCMDVQKNKWDHLWCIAREHYKSLIITCASTLWELLKDPNETYCIVSYNITTATAFLGTIKSWCETKDLIREVWSDRIWADPQKGYVTNPDGTRKSFAWKQNQIELIRTRDSKEKSVEVSGIEGGLKTGGHYSRIIFDDAETPDTVRTAEGIQSAYEACRMSTNIGQTDNLNMCFIGTFYAKDDLYVRLIKDGFFSEAIIQPCYDWRTQEPILYTQEVIEEKLRKMGIEAFVTQMLCDPSLSSSSAFKSEWWQKWEPSNLTGLNIYFVVDPAGNKQNKGNDNTCIVVVGIDALENFMVIDIVRDKLNADSKFTTLVTLYNRYMPIGVYYEEESMQSDIALIQKQMAQVNMRFPIMPYSMKKYGSKENRIKQLSAPLMNGKWYFPQHCYHSNWKGESEDMITSLYREEYLGFPVVTHDDGLDVLATIYIMFINGTILAPKGRGYGFSGVIEGGFYAEDAVFEEVEDSMDGLL